MLGVNTGLGGGAYSAMFKLSCIIKTSYFFLDVNEIIKGLIALIHYVYIKCRDHFTSVSAAKVLSSL